MSYVKFVAGFLGGGKGKLSVSIIQEYLKAGRPVATNMNLYLDKLVSPRNKISVTRIPDKPRIEDLKNLGYSYTGKYNDKKNGLLVLDELGTWFNSRDWRDKSRKEVIDFMLHIRKYGWDVLLQVQDISMVDSQLRSGTGQLLTQCTNMSQVPIFLISKVYRLLTGKSLYWPEFHHAKTFLGGDKSGLKLESFFFKRGDLHKCYDTRQVFQMDEVFIGDELIDMRASYCELSAWHLKGRYIGSLSQRIKKEFIKQFLLLVNYLDFIFTGKRRRAAGRLPVKGKTYLVRTIQNEDKPLLINPDNLYLFPVFMSAAND